MIQCVHLRATASSLVAHTYLGLAPRRLGPGTSEGGTSAARLDAAAMEYNLYITLKQSDETLTVDHLKLIQEPGQVVFETIRCTADTYVQFEVNPPRLVQAHDKQGSSGGDSRFKLYGRAILASDGVGEGSPASRTGVTVSYRRGRPRLQPDLVRLPALPWSTPGGGGGATTSAFEAAARKELRRCLTSPDAAARDAVPPCCKTVSCMAVSRKAQSCTEVIEVTAGEDGPTGAAAACAASTASATEDAGCGTGSRGP